tara:strand:- start:32 stop:289 length:258 start_codon:yes stop_codon:yes gene_type:complete
MTNELTYDEYEAIENAAASVNGRIYADYSGRGMFGDNCIGVVLKDESDLFRFSAYLDDALVERLGSPELDALGLAVIAYWPRFTT